MSDPWERIEALHTRTQTTQGPDFCRECSEAAQEWHSWPCANAAAIAQARQEWAVETLAETLYRRPDGTTFRYSIGITNGTEVAGHRTVTTLRHVTEWTEVES